MSPLKHIVRGCGTLPGYGDHPGTATLVFFVLMGAVSGAHAGWRGALVGVLVSLAIFGPMYLIGAYQRSRDQSMSEPDQ